MKCFQRCFSIISLFYVIWLEVTLVQCHEEPDSVIRPNRFPQLVVSEIMPSPLPTLSNIGCTGETALRTNEPSPNGDTPTEPLENMIKNAGYESKKYTATTKDGYILGLYRICKRSKKTEKPRCSKGTPVLLVHGLLTSPESWLLNDKTKALPYKLVEDGKDVWLAANRGTTHSQRHETLSTKDPKFWDFTHVEMGLYDVPAFMDKIKDVTKEEKVHYIGHGLGTKQYFTLMSQFPGNCSRIKAMWALAPVAYLRNQKSVPLQLLATGIAPLGIGRMVLGDLEFQPECQSVKTATSAFCSLNAGCPVCQNVLFTLMGYNPKQSNRPWMATQMGHFPSVTSAKNMIHNAQEIMYNRFGHLDYGLIQNSIKYGMNHAMEPPQFKLSNIAMNTECTNIHMVYSESDLIANKQDVQTLYKELGSAVTSFSKVSDFSHLDFLTGKDADAFIYDNVLQEMKEYDK